MILSYIRSGVLYLALIGAMRLLGKRQIGQLEPSELVVTMLVADLAAIPMQDGSISLLSGLVPILTVLALELVLSGLSLKSIGLRRVLCGKPVILIDNGVLCQRALKSARVTMDELSGHLRSKGALDISQVQYAILETDGTLSVFLYPENAPASAMDAGVKTRRQYLPVTVISDGCLLGENLKKAKKDGAWLQGALRERSATMEGTWLLTVDETGCVFHIPKEESL